MPLVLARGVVWGGTLIGGTATVLLGSSWLTDSASVVCGVEVCCGVSLGPPPLPPTVDVGGPVFAGVTELAVCIEGLGVGVGVALLLWVESWLPEL